MLTKTKIALSTLLIIGSASAALAFEPVENKIGHRYPALERAEQAALAAEQSAGASAFASAAVKRPVMRFTSAEHALFERTSRLGNN